MPYRVPHFNLVFLEPRRVGAAGRKPEGANVRVGLPILLRNNSAIIVHS